MGIEQVTVIGAGTMGAGIAGQAALCGMTTTLFDVNPEQIDRGLLSIKKSYEKGVARQKLTSEATGLAHGRLTTSSDLKSAVSEATLVIEAVPENMELKQSLFQQIESFVSAQTILASNTSSLSITAIASVLKRPEQCVGLHFFNPSR